jgi:hypothetical protein
MRFLRTGLAVLFGMVSGMAVSRIPAAKANPQPKGSVHVFIYPETLLLGHLSVDLPGYRVAGISCSAQPTKALPDGEICYVATTLAQ